MRKQWILIQGLLIAHSVTGFWKAEMSCNYSDFSLPSGIPQANGGQVGS